MDTGFVYREVLWYVQLGRRVGLTADAIRYCFRCDVALGEHCGSGVAAGGNLLERSMLHA